MNSDWTKNMTRGAAAATILLALAACGGGGDDGKSPDTGSPDTGTGTDTGIGTGTGTGTGGAGFGVLTVTGAGASKVGGAFTPQSLGSPSTTGPNCVVVDGANVCSSGYAVGWTESSTEQLLTIFQSYAIPSPGVAPGTGVNGLYISYIVALQSGFLLQCGLPGTQPPCDFAALGITLDTDKRTVTFVNTPLPSEIAGGEAAIVNGTVSF